MHHLIHKSTYLLNSFNYSYTHGIFQVEKRKTSNIKKLNILFSHIETNFIQNNIEDFQKA